MEKERDRFIKNIRYLCLIGVIALGLMTIVGSSAGGGGSGGGGGEAVASTTTAPSQNIQGTYTFSKFKVKYFYPDGSTFIIREYDVSASGTFKIGESTLTQQITLDNETMAISGTYVIDHSRTTREGIFFTAESTGFLNGFLYFCSGNDLITFNYMTLPDGTTFYEWDYWTKTSDALAKLDEIKGLDDTELEEFRYITVGELLEY